MLFGIFLQQLIYVQVIDFGQSKPQVTHPNSLRDSKVSPKLKTTEKQIVEARSLARSTIER
jgi:hypothetical protein